MAGIAVGYCSVDDVPVLLGEMQAVFAHHGFDFKFKTHLQLPEYLADLRLANLVVAHIVKIDFVDRAASGDNQEFIHYLSAIIAALILPRSCCYG